MRRDTLVLSFPRAAGTKVRRVWLGGAAARPQLPGVVLYQPRPGRAGRGLLYITLGSFDAGAEDTQWSPRGVPTVAAAELLVTTASRGGPPRSHRYELSWAAERGRQHGSFAVGETEEYVPWRVDVDLLWEVGHLVGSRERGEPPAK